MDGFVVEFLLRLHFLVQSACDCDLLLLAYTGQGTNKLFVRRIRNKGKRDRFLCTIRPGCVLSRSHSNVSSQPTWGPGALRGGEEA